MSSAVSQKKIGKLFTIYSSGRAVGMLFSVLLIPLFAREMPQAEFGFIGILWFIIPLLSRAMNLGLDAALGMKFFKLTHQERSLYLYNVLLCTVAIGVAIMAVGLWKINWIQFAIGLQMTRNGYFFLILAVFFSICVTITQAFFQYEGKAVKNIIFSICPPVIITVTTYLLVCYVDKNYISYLKGLVLGYGIFTIVGILYFLKKYSLNCFYVSLPVIKQLLRIGWPTIPSTVGGILLASGDRYVIKWALGLNAVAVYTYGYRFAEYVASMFLEPYQKALGPILMNEAAKDSDKASCYNADVVYTNSVFFPILVGLIIVPMKNIMFWLGGAKYIQSYWIFLLAVIGILFFHVRQISSIILNHFERADLNMYIVIGAALLNLVLNICLVPKYGIIMAAVTTIICYFLMLFSTIFIANFLMSTRINLRKVLVRILPFLVFISGVFYMDWFADGFSAFQSCSLKFLMFLIMFCVMFIFEEMRKGVARIGPFGKHKDCSLKVLT
ncbi:MAG: oligosaccharide flippase family protein [Candidatus Omnitrophica bacterium]|nr:oligosaccharide flippase family protein [Candidatus Omnitrophota bacterium]